MEKMELKQKFILVQAFEIHSELFHKSFFIHFLEGPQMCLTIVKCTELK